MVAATSFYGVELSENIDRAPASTSEIMQVFEILKPKASATPLMRIGGDFDGSYLVPDDLDGIAACFSPGVNRVKHFEDFLTDHYGVAAHMCDFTCDVDEFKTPLREGRQTFRKKWLDVTPGEDNISLEDWIRDHDVAGDLLLQMDIEGAEYRNLLATSDDTLAQFRVIVIEVHGLGQLLDGPILRGVLAPFFTKLARGFVTVHAHPNNCCGDFAVPDTDIRIPNLLELTLVRKDRFVPAEGPPSLPHPLDVSRNVPGRPPLFLSDVWVDHRRPLESRVKMLEDLQHYQETVGASTADRQWSGVLSMLMQSLQTIAPLRTQRAGDLVEVAEGRRFRLSSAYGSSSRTGVVKRSDRYFFHTGFGPNQSITVDLGSRRRVRRIEVTNRRGGYQERAKFIFAVLRDRDGEGGGAKAFPMYQTGELPGGAWQECSIDLPDVEARYVTITTPINTALHFSDLRIYAPKGGLRPGAISSPSGAVKSLVGRAMRNPPGTVRALSVRAARRAPAPVKALGRRVLRPGRPARATRSDDGATGVGDAKQRKERLYVLDACATYEIPVNGLVHVGANRADEYPTYHARTHGPLLYIEAIPELAERARRRLDPNRPHDLREALVSDTAGETVTFHVASNDGGSSSMLAPGPHAEKYPWITFDSTLELVTERLDDIIAERPEAAEYNVLTLDVQGAELKVLKGAPKLLAQVDAVFAEVSSEPLYENGCTFLEITNLLAEAGLVFRTAEMSPDGWGDAFYSRPRTALHEMLSKNLAHGKETRQSSFYGPGTGNARLIGDVLPRDYGVHTAPGDDEHWWEVDLGSPTGISRVIYLDRPKHLGRAASLRISTSLDGTRYDLIYRREGKPLETIIDIRAPVTARYVRVSLEDGGPLHFRQVIVV